MAYLGLQPLALVAYPGHARERDPFLGIYIPIGKGDFCSCRQAPGVLHPDGNRGVKGEAVGFEVGTKQKVDGIADVVAGVQITRQGFGRGEPGDADGLLFSQCAGRNYHLNCTPGVLMGAAFRA